MSRLRAALTRAEGRLLRRYTYASPLALGRMRLNYDRRPRSAWMGRFGGGWQWNLGVQVGGRSPEGAQTVILNLLVCSVRIRINPKNGATS